ILTVGSTTGPSLSVTGSFTTKASQAKVIIERIHVLSGGDEWGSGEMRFDFGVYATEDGTLLGGPGSYPDPASGHHYAEEEWVTLNREFPIASPPDKLTLVVYGHDDDTGFWPWQPGPDPRGIVAPPLGSGQNSGEDEWGEWATGEESFVNIAGQISGTQS